MVFEKYVFLKNKNMMIFASGADDGNRTHVSSLEGWGFTIKLHPRVDGVGFEPT